MNSKYELNGNSYIQEFTDNKTGISFCVSAVHTADQRNLAVTVTPRNGVKKSFGAGPMRYLLVGEPRPAPEYVKVVLTELDGTPAEIARTALRKYTYQADPELELNIGTIVDVEGVNGPRRGTVVELNATDPKPQYGYSYDVLRVV